MNKRIIFITCFCFVAVGFGAINAGEVFAKDDDYRYEMRKKWKNFSYEEKERLKDRRERFEDLSPEKREELRRKWKKFEDLSPEERERFRKKSEKWKSLSEEEKEQLEAIVNADAKVGQLRGFLSGVWHLFEDSEDEEAAREALEDLKAKDIDRQNPTPFHQVIHFLETHFEWMTTFLREEGVQRNSLSETSLRTLRRLEIEHDGFRSETGREDFLRIYQAIKYLGWNVYEPAPKSLKPG